ncbi:hypothetical protein V5799_012597, partial [Amblyomma americanum]
LLSNASQVHAEGGVENISEVRAELVGSSDECNPDAYPWEDWSEELVDDTITAIELIKECCSGEPPVNFSHPEFLNMN